VRRAGVPVPVSASNISVRVDDAAPAAGHSAIAGR
jgi:hypothetical protein